MALGEALAVGIAQGLGEGFGDYFKDQRRERMETRRMDKSFDMFKKQSQYSFALQEIGKQNEALGAWEEAAKMGVNDLAFKAATRMAETYSKEDRPKFIRDTMKQFSGMSKAELLVRAGYQKPDYSQWIDNPDYQDAIPQARIAGMGELPDAASTFKYDPRQWEQQQQVQAEKMTDYMRKKQDEFKSINTMGVISFGASLSDDVKNFIWKNRPEGVSAQLKGSEVISYDQNLLTSLINNGQVVKIGSELKFVGEIPQEDQGLLGVDQGVPTEGPAVAQPLYTEPQTEQYLTEQEAEKEQKEKERVLKSISKELGKGKGTPLTTYTELNDAVSMVDTMSDDALDYMFTVGFSNETVRDVAAKFGDDEAQKAKDLISKMAATVNSIRHELFGSALTEGEAAKFREQFTDVGVFNNKANLKSQLQNLMNRAQLGVAEKMAGFTPEQRRDFLQANPNYEGVMGQTEVAQGEQPGTAGTQDTKETVSDLSMDSQKQEIAAFVDSLIQQGEYDEQDREGLIQHLLNKANQPIQ